ncbi:HET-domain-containing protein [Apiospora saccharicola]|uniref:HET-domain-containing protein n=1 Tax=Apiospora saccharicola TaxID=335842 RepID=A0ABR1US12_9PEZI
MERSEQIPLMADIYKLAKLVIAYLGESREHSPAGIEILSYLSGESDFDDNAPWSRLSDSEVLHSIDDIIQRPYFERLWVVQEAALAQRIEMRVGMNSLAWSTGSATRRFLARIKLFELSPTWSERVDLRPLRELLDQSLADKARRNNTVELPSLLDIVHSVRHRKVVDRRDTLYGVMSLANPADIANLVVDYTESWEETYRRFFHLAQEQVTSHPESTLADMR